MYRQLIFLVLCCLSSALHLSAQDSTLVFDINHKYILLPIDEQSPVIKMQVVSDNETFHPTYYLKLARKQPAYWVTLDVNAYRSKTIALRFENIQKETNALKTIYQSDSLQFNYNEPFRPAIHFTPTHGWMNDPNGMVFFNGEYHLFYQYNPYASEWGNMHWGHAVSKDMIHWGQLPIALKMDSLGDIFSGSAVIDAQNTAGFGTNAMIAIYTSNGKTQQQSIAYSTDNGRTFQKYAGNPVLANPGIIDFRDPKVFWYAPSRRWIMSLATGQSIRFYSSPNLKEWQQLSEFGNNTGAHGGVWECPDLIQMSYKGQSRWVLIVNINPGAPNGGSGTQYFVGQFDGREFKADALPYPLWLDYGKDNYAGVSWNNIPTKDGRKLFLGWMSNWEYANRVPTLQFRSAMTIARSLQLADNGKYPVLCSYPVTELNKYRHRIMKTSALHTTETRVTGFLEKAEGCFDLELTADPQQSRNFELALLNDSNETIRFIFDLKKLLLQTDRSTWRNRIDKTDAMSTAPLPLCGRYTIRLIVDKASTELFINDGMVSSTHIVFPQTAWTDILLKTNDNHVASFKNITLYQLSK